MKEHERLAESDRHLHRTAMDVLEVLRKEAGFHDDDCAEVFVGFLRLPSGDNVGLVDIRFDSPARQKISVVSLPTSTHFNAKRQGFSFSQRFEITRLNQASIDSQGHVELADGNMLRAIEVEPVRLPYHPSELDWRIVHLILELKGATHCYRSLQDGLPPHLRSMVPDRCFLDVDRLSGLDLPSLRDLTRYIASKHKRVSGQQIANSLRKFGIRHPQARPA